MNEKMKFKLFDGGKGRRLVSWLCIVLMLVTMIPSGLAETGEEGDLLPELEEVVTPIKPETPSEPATGSETTTTETTAPPTAALETVAPSGEENDSLQQTEEVTFTVTFTMLENTATLNGDTKDVELQVANGASIAGKDIPDAMPTVENSMFQGWYDAKDQDKPDEEKKLLTALDLIAIPVTEDITYIAKMSVPETENIEELPLVHAVTFAIANEDSLLEGVAENLTVFVEDGKMLAAHQIPTVDPAAGYENTVFEGWMDLNTWTLYSKEQLTEMPIMADITFTAQRSDPMTASETEYAVNINVGENGSATPSGALVVSNAQNLQITVTPSAGYLLDTQALNDQGLDWSYVAGETEGSLVLTFYLSKDTDITLSFVKQESKYANYHEMQADMDEAFGWIMSRYVDELNEKGHYIIQGNTHPTWDSWVKQIPAWKDLDYPASKQNSLEIADWMDARFYLSSGNTFRGLALHTLTQVMGPDPNGNGMMMQNIYSDNLYPVIFQYVDQFHNDHSFRMTPVIKTAPRSPDGNMNWSDYVTAETAAPYDELFKKIQNIQLYEGMNIGIIPTSYVDRDWWNYTYFTNNWVSYRILPQVRMGSTDPIYYIHDFKNDGVYNNNSVKVSNTDTQGLITYWDAENNVATQPNGVKATITNISLNQSTLSQPGTAGGTVTASYPDVGFYDDDTTNGSATGNLTVNVVQKAIIATEVGGMETPSDIALPADSQYDVMTDVKGWFQDVTGSPADITNAGAKTTGVVWDVINTSGGASVDTNGKATGPSGSYVEVMYNLQETNHSYLNGKGEVKANVADTVTRRIMFADATPSVMITKTADRASVEPGQDIIYTITVSNKGIVELTNLVVTDDLTGTTVTIPSLAVGGRYSFQDTYTVPANNPVETRITNTARVVDTKNGLDETASAYVYCIAPGSVDYDLHVEKKMVSVSGESQITPDGHLGITYVNIGDMPSKVHIVYKITITNIGKKRFEKIAIDDAIAAYYADFSKLILDETLIYMPGDEGGPADVPENYYPGLNPGESLELPLMAYDYILPADYLSEGTEGVVIQRNAILVDGYDTYDSKHPNGIVKQGFDYDYLYIYAVSSPEEALLTKEVSPSTAYPGDTVKYTFQLESFPTDREYSWRLVDDMFGGVIKNGVVKDGVFSDTNNARVTDNKIEIEYRVPEGTKPGKLTNTARLEFAIKQNYVDQYFDGAPVRTYVDTAELTVLPLPEQGISLTKTVSPTTAEQGDTVTYSFKVTNTGETNLTNIKVTDAVLWPGETIGTIASLAAGGTQTITKQYTLGINQSLGILLNTAVVEGDSTFNGTTTKVNDEDSCELLVKENTKAAVSISKVAKPTNAKPGDVVTYTIVVTNTGKVDLKDIVITDAMLGYEKKFDTLPVGISTYPLTIDYTIPLSQGDGTVVNTADVKAKDNNNKDVTDSTTASVNVKSPNKGIAITKTANVDRIDPGKTIQYTLTVKNIGGVDLSNVKVTDPLTGLNYSVGNLAIGAVVTIPANETDYLVPTDAEEGTLTNTATATGTAPDNSTVTSEAKVDVHINGAPSLQVIKIVTQIGTKVFTDDTPYNPDTYKANPGDTVKYKITIANNGGVPLSNIKITDAFNGGAAEEVATYAGILEPGHSSFVGDITKTIPTTATDSVDNVAKASTTYNGKLVESEYTATVSLINPDVPSLAVTKTADPTSGKVGETITYTITVKNTGNVDLTNVKVTDPLTGLDQTIASLAKDATSNEITSTYELKEADIGKLTNTATAETTYDGKPVKGTDTADVTVTAADAPSLTVTKTADPTSGKVGETITYTITVKNTGNVDLTNVKVTDPLTGLDQTIASLAKGATSDEITSTYKLTEADIGKLTNTATAETTYDGKPVKGTDTADVTVTAADAPSLAVTKTADPTSGKVGETITYTITVKNTGNVDLTNVKVTDPLTGLDQTIASLAVGATSDEITSTYELKEEDICKLTNTATAETTYDGKPVKGTDTADVTVTSADAPSLEVTKSASKDTGYVGEGITYTITVKNTGNVDLTEIKVTDPLTGLNQTIASLKAGATSSAITSKYTLTAEDIGTLTNTATATATYNGDTVTDDDTADVTVEGLDVTLAKSVSATELRAGENITWTITVTNNSPTALKGFEVTDALPTDMLTGTPIFSETQKNGKWVIDLPANDSYEITVTGTLKKDLTAGTEVVNTASAHDPSFPADDTSEEATLTSSVTTKVIAPELVVTKTVDKAEVLPNGTVTYEILVANEGDADATKVAFKDTLNNLLTATTADITVDPAAGNNVKISGQEITGTLSIAKGASVAVTVVAKVAKTAADGTVIKNVAFAQDQTQPTNPGKEVSNEKEPETTVVVPNVTVAKTDSVNGAANIGTNFTYTITASNNGTGAATGVTVTDAYPAELTIVDAAGGTVDATNHTITWTGVNLDAKTGSVEYVLTVRIDKDKGIENGDELTNKATTSDPSIDPTKPVTDEAEDTVTVAAPVISITKDDGTDTVEIDIDGTRIYTYKITVTNDGNTDAKDVAVTDTLPTNVALRLGTIQPAPEAQSATELTWKVNVPANGKVEITIPYTIPTGTADGTEIVNVVSAKDPTRPDDEDPATAEDTNTVKASKLGIEIDDFVTDVEIGTPQYTYKITVENSGSGDAKNAHVWVDWPSQLILVDAGGGIANGSSTSTTKIDFNGLEIPANDKIELFVVMKVKPGTPDGTAIRTVASVEDPASTVAIARALTATTDDDIDNVKASDVSIKKESSIADGAMALIGDTITYTITVTNEGSADAKGATVTDTLPAQLEKITAENDGTVTDTKITWTVDVPAKGTTVLKYSGVVKKATPDKTEVKNVVEVYDPTDPPLDPDGNPDPEGDPEDKKISETIDTVAASIINIVKTADIEKAKVGEIITYTITVTNTGTAEGKNISVTDVMPEFLDLVSTTPNAVVSDINLSWTIASIAANGGESKILVVARVTDKVNPTFVNTAVAVDPTDPENPKSSEVTTDLNNIEIAKSADTELVMADDTINYTITVTNKGAAQKNLTVSDELPAGLTTTDETTWAIAEMAPGEVKTFTIAAIVTEEAKDSLKNIAKVTDEEGNEKTDTLITPVKTSDVTLVKSADKESAKPGDTITYTVVATNKGKYDETDLTVNDTLDDKLEYVSSTPAATVAGQKLSFAIASLRANGGTSTITITAKVKASATGVIENTAEMVNPVDPTKDPIPSNTVKTPVRKVVISKVADKSEAYIGDMITYTITVENQGGAAVVDYVVSDKLSSMVDFVVAGTTENYKYNNGTVIWTTDLAKGETKEYKIVVEVNDTASGNIRNVAILKDSTNPEDPDVPSDPVDVKVKGAKLTKTADKLTVKPGDTITYTITAENKGDEAIAGFEVVDDVDNRLENITATPEATIDGQKVTWTTDLDKTAEFTITATVKADAVGTLHNIAIGNDPEDPEKEYPSDEVNTPISSVEVVKTTDKETAKVGDTITYTVTVTNKGDEALADGYTTSDTLPKGLTLVAEGTTEGYTEEGAKLIWDISGLAAGSSKNITIVAEVAEGAKGTIKNVAVVTDPDQPKKPIPSDPVETEIVDVTITKTADKASVKPGDEITYTVTVTNKGENAVKDYLVEDALDARLTFVSADPEAKTNGAKLSWTINNLAGNGEIATFVIKAKVNDDAEGIIENTAVVTGPKDSDEPIESETVKTPVRKVSVAKTVDKTIAKIGDTLVYTIVATNEGEAPVKNYVVSDELPVGLELVNATAGYELTGNKLSWTIVSLTDTATFTITAKISEGAKGPIENTALLTDPDDPDDPDEPDKPTKTDIVDFTIEKAASAEIVMIGDELTYTITLTNTGNVDLKSVEVSDEIPDGLTVKTTTPAATVEGSKLSWISGTIAAGANEVYTIKAEVTAEAAGILKNTAIATKPVDPTNPEDPEITKPSNPVETKVKKLSITKQVNKTSAMAGDTLVYTILVTNDGAVDYNEITVTDKLPAGLKLVSSDPAATEADGQLSWTIEGLKANGGNATITVAAMVEDDAEGTLTNSATAVDKDDPYNPFVSNEVKTVISDISIAKFVDKTRAKVGDDVVYTITVTNNGKEVATDLQVSDTLPDGLTFKSFDPRGSISGNTVRYTISKLEAGASQNFQIIATVNEDAAEALRNVAIVIDKGNDPEGKNPIPSNETVTVVSKIKITKVADKEAVRPGDEISYTITVRNLGYNDETNLTVEDVLDDMLTLVSTSPATNVAISGQNIKWTIASLTAKTGEVILTINATVKDDAKGIIENVAAVNDPTDPTKSIPSNPVETPVKNYTITKTVSAEKAKAGDELIYTITATNDGEIDISGLKVEDAIDSRLEIISTEPEATAAGQTVVWNDVSIAIGGKAEFIIKVKVAKGAEGTIENVAFLTDPVDPTKPIPTDPTETKISDIKITKKAAVHEIIAGREFDYTITVRNDGKYEETALKVTDTLPDTLEIVDAGDMTAAGNQLTATIDKLAAGASKTYTIKVKVKTDAEGIIENVAEVTDPSDPTGETKIPTDPTETEVLKPEISIVKTHDGKIIIDEPYTYRIEVTNSGNGAAEAVTVTDTYPEELTIISASDGGEIDETAHTITWTLNKINGNGTVKVLNVQAIVNKGVDDQTEITNSVLASDPTVDPENPTEVTDEDTDVVNAPVVKIAKTSDAENHEMEISIEDDERVYTYTITVKNEGHADAHDVIVEDEWPADMEIREISDDGVETTAEGATTIKWTLDSLAVGEEKELTVTGVVKKSTDDGTEINNTVTATDPTDPPIDPENPEEDKTDTTTDTVKAPIISIEKKSYDETPMAFVTIDQIITYTITVKNSGTGEGRNVVVTDTLPAELDKIELSDGGTIEDGVATWTVNVPAATEAGDGETVVTVSGRVKKGTDNQTVIKNEVIFDDPTDPEKPEDDTKDDDENTVHAAIISVKKEADLASVKIGDTLVYTITVSNTGDYKGENVVVTDVMPAWLDLVSTDPQATVSGNTLTWTLEDVPAKGEVAIKVTVTVGGKVDASFTNTATAVDPTDPDNPQTSEVTTSLRNIVITKVADKELAKVGDTINYTITVTNKGVSCENIAVSDTLPAGLILDTANTTDGKLEWTIDSIATGETKTFNVAATVTAEAADSIENVASATNPEGDVKEAKTETSKETVELSATKVASKADVKAGEEFTYTITVKNDGKNDAKDVPVRDTLDAQLTLVSAEPQATVEGQKLSWTIASLAAGKSQSIQITVKVNDDATGTIKNTAIVTDPTDPGKEIETPPVETPVKKVTIAKTANVTTVKVGDEVTYTITAKNEGEADVEGYLVEDELNSMLTLVAAKTTAGYDLSGRKLTWEIDLAKGETKTFTVVATVNDTASGTIKNVANLVDPKDPTDPDPSDPAETPVKGMKITKTVNKTSAKPGDTIEYLVTVEKTGDANYDSIVVSDTVSDMLTIVTTEPAATISGQNVSWTTPLDSTKVFKITAIVKEDAKGTIRNIAIATDPTDPTNPETSEETETAVSDIVVTKTVDKTVAKAGDELVYTITVTNTGAKKYEGSLNVTDELADALTLIPEGTTADYTLDDTIVSWTLTDLAAGAIATYTIHVKIADNASGTIKNVAIATNPTDPENPIPSIPAETDLAELSIEKTADKKTAKVGEVITYVITVTNKSNADAANLSVSDTLADSLELVSAEGAQVSGKTLTWTIANLAKNAKQTFTVSAKVADGATGTIRNIAIVTDPTDPTNPKPSDPSDVPVRNVTIEKTVDKKSAKKGDILNYTIVVKNNGDSTVENYKVSDDLPAGLEFVRATAGYSIAGQKVSWNLLSLAAGKTATYTITAKVGENASGTIKNVAILTDPTDPEDPITPVDPPETEIKDYSITKTVDKAEAKVGDTLTYTITLKNDGNTELDGIIVEDELSQMLDLVSTAPSAQVSGQNVSWTSGKVAVGASATFTITAKVNDKAKGSIENIAFAKDPDDPEDPGKPTDPIETGVEKVVIEKFVNKTSVKPGDTLVYTIKVTNEGDKAAQNLKVTDELPAGLTLRSTVPTATVNGTTLEWTIAELAGTTGEATFTITVQVNDDAVGTIRNVAILTDPTDPENPIPTDPVDTVVSDIVVEKKADKSVAKAGDKLTYTLTVENTGDGAAENLTVTDELPAGLTYESSTPAASVSGNTLTYTIASLAAGEKLTYTIIATVKDDADGRIRNVAIVKDPSDPDNPIPSTPADTDVSKIETTKKADKKAVKPGEEITYTITVKNLGALDASNLTVFDVLNDNLEFVSASPMATVSGQRITWMIEALPGRSGKAEFKIVAKVKENATGSIENIGYITDPTDPTNPDPIPTDPVITPVKGQTITKTADKEKAKIGDTITYTINLTNTGNGDLVGAIVEDVLSDAFEYVSSTPEATTAGQTLSWTAETLAPNATATFTLVVKVKEGAKGTIDNVAIFTDPSDPEKPIPSEPEPVKISDVRLTKVASATRVSEGEEFDYVITAKNHGAYDETNLVIKDEVPAGLEIVSTDGGTNNNGVVTWNVASLASGASVSFTLKVKLTSEVSGTITNVAKVVDPANPDDPGTGSEPSIVDVSKIEVTKEVDKSVARVGDLLRYTITVKNAGTSEETNLKVTDTLPIGLDCVSATGSARYNSSTRVVTWTVASLAPGATKKLTLLTRVNSEAGDNLINTVVVTDPANPDKPTVSDPANVYVSKLSITKSTTTTTAKVGDTVTYTITVTNAGTREETGLTVTDKLPTGLRFKSADNGGTYKSGTVTWKIASIPAKSSVTLTLAVRLTSAASGKTIKNVANLSDPANPGQTIPSESSNVTVDKSSSSNTPKTGDTLPILPMAIAGVSMATLLAAVVVLIKRKHTAR